MTIIQMLTKAGFTMSSPICGTTQAEACDVDKHHFTPKYRDVFIGRISDEGGGGYYVTSNIKGVMRRYRCRRIDDVALANIFAYGNTKRKAVEAFIRKFESKAYNVR